MKIDIDQFRVPPGKPVHLDEWPTGIDPVYRSKADYRDMLHRHTEDLASLQARLYASAAYAVLLIFQAMDAAGKDSAIEHVMSGVNPQGCEVFSFKQPSAEERAHDFLWRTTCRLPQRGRIGIFNRSYYEEVLIARVHPELLEGQAIAPSEGRSRRFWEQRYESINDLEKHLHRNGTRIIKLFLHVSRDEQRKRFLDRLDQPDKNWKFNEGDIQERKYWKRYMKAYEQCLAGTSTRQAPWYVVPADDKASSRLIVSRIILATMRALHLQYPQPDAARLEQLRGLRALLT
jgi:PPK2 family polyphosphate:nucleotide phosphotransferase